LFGTHFSDITYGYNAIWREHREKLAPEIDGWAHEIVGNIRAARHGLRVVEVASRESPRLGGQAKLKTFPAGWAILRAIVAERFRSLPAPVAQLDSAGMALNASGTATMSFPVQLQLITEPAAEQADIARPLDTQDATAKEVLAIPIMADLSSHTNGRTAQHGASRVASVPIQPDLALAEGHASPRSATRG
jgi:hypothetical protein